ncbi:MAG: ATP/GTP-binding protein [Lachnospiraceae bacterium]
MIYEFSFSNFRSYKSKRKLDFSAKPISEFKESLIKKDKNTNLLPVCVVYGPNGGGKSGVLLALNTLRNIIIDPLLQMAFMKKKNEKLAEAPMEVLQESLKKEQESEYYFKWDDEGMNIPTAFNILFSMDSVKYRYELMLKESLIVEENLYYEKPDGIADAVFERDAEGVYLCDELEGVDIEKMNDGLPVLSYIALFKDIEIIDRAIQFFLKMHFIDFDRPRQDRQILVKAIEKDKERIFQWTKRMGIDISDIRVEYDNNGNVVEIYTLHERENGEFKELKLKEESSGTRKVISILPMLLSGIDRGDFFVIDELDAKLHPMLLQRIIEMFTDPANNENAAQLLFASHDMTTMSNKVFRRDEIWFSAINGYGESVLYSLVDFKKENGKKPRNDEDYNKQYLEGRYGANPYFYRMQNWEDTDVVKAEEKE